MTTHLCIHGEVFTQTRKTVDWIASRTGWPIVTDRDLIEAASQRATMPAIRLERLLMKPEGVLNRLTHGTDRALATVQSVMVDKLAKKTTIFHGSLGLPVTRRLPQVLNVLLTASPRFRINRARRTKTLTERQARSLIHHRDRREFEWYRNAFGDDRFDTKVYDLVIPADRLDTESTGRLILEQLMRTEMRVTVNPANQFADLQLTAKVLDRMSKGGYHIAADAYNGSVRLTVDRPVLFFNRLVKRLEREVLQIKGVRDVQTTAGPNFFQTDIYRRCRFELSDKVAFRSFRHCRRRLHHTASACFPSAKKQAIGQDRIHTVQRLASSASS